MKDTKKTTGDADSQKLSQVKNTSPLQHDTKKSSKPVASLAEKLNETVITVSTTPHVSQQPPPISSPLIYSSIYSPTKDTFHAGWQPPSHNVLSSTSTETTADLAIKSTGAVTTRTASTTPQKTSELKKGANATLKKQIIPLLEDLLRNNRLWAERLVKNDPLVFSRLSKQQSPNILWIGCSDSRGGVCCWC